MNAARSSRKPRPFGGMVHSRLTEIAQHHNTRISVGIALIAGLLLLTLEIPTDDTGVAITDVVGPILSLTGFGFAVATTAVAVVLALPLSRLSALMVLNGAGAARYQVVDRPDGRVVLSGVNEEELANFPVRVERSGYLDLVFVFAWTAMANIFASLATLVWLIAFGTKSLLANPLVLGDVLSALVLGLVLYATLQMISSLVAAYNFANVANTAYRARILSDTRESIGLLPEPEGRNKCRGRRWLRRR